MNDGINISLYSDRMQNQVCHLFVNQYQVDFDSFKNQFVKFYEHDFQKNRCIRIVAIDGEKVVGFQSFFFWPYKNRNDIYKSYQSGNSIVAPSHRGKGLFQRMLSYAEETLELHDIDFVVGFPVEASFKSFIKCGWNNVLDLQWIASIVNPFGILFNSHNHRLNYSNKFTKESVFETEATHYSDGDISLQLTKEFRNWRNSFSETNSFFFSHKHNGESVEFELKLNHRGKLHECIIGRINGQEISNSGLMVAFKSLKKSLLIEAPSVTLLTIAANPHHHSFKRIQHSMGFFSRTLNRKIRFIVKNAVGDELNNPANWVLYRSDIDTW